jgi:predicted outer membrane repeat protein
VSLTGVNSATTILQALPAQRVLTVTGAAVDSSVVISGLTFTGGSLPTGNCPESCGAGLLIADSAQPRLENLRILNNAAGQQGGGLYATGSVTLSSVSFISNTANIAGGGAASVGSAAVYGGLFQGNQADQGGGLYAGPLFISGTRFIGNVATFSGGAGAFGTAATVQGAWFEGNRCGEFPLCQGGGLNVGYPVIVTGTSFVSNVANMTGGGLAATGVVTITGGLFQDNSCPTVDSCHGGGLYAGGELSMTGTQFLSNTTTSRGGGAVAVGEAIIEHVLFQGNACSQNGCRGGGLYANADLTLTSSRFIANGASSGGGLAQSDPVTPFGSPNARIINALFARNAATVAGSAMLLASPGTIAILHTTVGKPTTAGGSAIAVISGTVSITNSVITSHTIGISVTAGTVTEAHNLFFSNGSNLAGPVTPGGGSLTLNPLFRSPATDDYHLRSASPARELGVDAGVYIDADNHLRPQAGGFDVGYDEFPAQTLKLFLPFVRR